MTNIKNDYLNTVIPAKAGMTKTKNDYLKAVIPAQAGIQLHFTVASQSNSLSNPPNG